MGNSLKPYLDLILTQRDWSWAVIGIVYLVVALTIRGWFLNPVVHRSKDLEKKYCHELKKVYLEQSVWGWLLFLASFLIVILLWNTALHFPVTVRQALFALAAIACFVLSVIFHLIAFGMAAVLTLKKATQTQLDL